MTDKESLFAALREKAGDGSTDFVVDVRQGDLAALLRAFDAASCEASSALPLIWALEADETHGNLTGSVEDAWHAYKGAVSRSVNTNQTGGPSFADTDCPHQPRNQDR